MTPARSALLGVLFATTVASAAAAQDSVPSVASFGVATGKSSPTGNTRALYDGGELLGGLAEVRTPLSWVAVRVDAGYQRIGNSTFDISDASGSKVGDSHVVTGLFSASASLAVRVPNLHTVIRPYALAGFGSYWLRQNVSWSDQRNAANPTGASSVTRRINGNDAGWGLEAPLSRMVIYAEQRFQVVGPGPLRFSLISGGVRVPKG